MTQNHLILIFIIELALFYLIIYSLSVANRWVNEKREFLDELSISLHDSVRAFRDELRKMNKKLMSTNIDQPLSYQEIGTLFSGIVSDIFKSKIPIPVFGKKFAVLSVFYRLWKYRHRIRATIFQR